MQQRRIKRKERGNAVTVGFFWQGMRERLNLEQSVDYRRRVVHYDTVKRTTHVKEEVEAL